MWPGKLQYHNPLITIFGLVLSKEHQVCIVASRIQLCWYVDQSLCILQRAQLCCAFIVDITEVSDIELWLGKHTNTFLATEQFHEERKNTAAFYWPAGNICPD